MTRYLLTPVFWLVAWLFQVGDRTDCQCGCNNLNQLELEIQPESAGT